MRNLRSIPAIVFPIAMLIVLGMAAQVSAQECVSAQCHSSMGKAKFVHGPVGVGQCVVCHTNGNPKHPTKSVKTDFKLQATGKDLCYLCHEPKDTLPVVHGPIAKGDTALPATIPTSPTPRSS